MRIALPVVALVVLTAGCQAGPEAPVDVGPRTDAAGDASPLDAEDLTPDLEPDGGVTMDAAVPALALGATARVTAGSLNLRTGPGTSNAVLTSMPCGTRVTLLAGPSSGWWQVAYGARMGWSSGAYLVAEPAFRPEICGGGDAGTPDAAAPGADGATPAEVGGIFDRARLAVGYSYYWGHGSWRDDGQSVGACSGSCPGCSHTGAYGADCSGFVAKCWQVPGPSAITTDLHPYATYNFFNQTTHWSVVPRAAMQPADALVYNANGAGHIILFESGTDPWGSIWTYEARGCATGVVHNLRTAGATYIAIRREGL